MAKEVFEEWLKEKAWVEIKHYHSDNGVFTAEEFREDCKEKNQTQYFLELALNTKMPKHNVLFGPLCGWLASSCFMCQSIGQSVEWVIFPYGYLL